MFDDRGHAGEEEDAYNLNDLSDDEYGDEDDYGQEGNNGGGHD